MKNVTGPITVGLDSTRRNPRPGAEVPPKGIVRNIAFNGIRGFVVAEGKQHLDLPWPQKFRPGETRHCIVVNGANEDVLENISFQDIQFTYEGGGTADEAVREVPQVAGEYFEIGTPPAFGMYARNVRGLTLNNVRFEVLKKDLRPALVFERVSDAAVNGLSVQGNTEAEALIRLTNSQDVLFAGTRVLTPTSALLKLVGPKSAAITIDGGDVSKVQKPLLVSGGAVAKSVTLRR
jgi:hypothetical protein